MAPIITVEEFFELVNKYYGYLVTDYGFELKKREFRVARFFSENVQISVIYDKDQLDTTIKIIGKAAEELEKQGVSSEPIDVGYFASLLGASGHFRHESFYLRSLDLIEEEMALRSKQIMEYCVYLFEGDLSSWIKVSKFR